MQVPKKHRTERERAVVAKKSHSLPNLRNVLRDFCDGYIERGQGSVRNYLFSLMLQQKPSSPAWKLPRVVSTLNCMSCARPEQVVV